MVLQAEQEARHAAQRQAETAVQCEHAVTVTTQREAEATRQCAELKASTELLHNQC